MIDQPPEPSAAPRPGIGSTLAASAACNRSSVVLLTILGALWAATAWFLTGPRIQHIQAAVTAIGWDVALVLAATVVTIASLTVWLVVRRAEAAHRGARQVSELHALLANARDSFPAAVQIKDADGRYVWGNKAYAQAIPQGVAEMLGKPATALGLPASLIDQIHTGDRHVLETGEAHGPAEQTIPRPDGNGFVTVPVIKVPLIRGGRVTHIVTCAAELAPWNETRRLLEETQ